MIDLLVAFINFLEVSCRYCVGLDGKQGLSSSPDHSCLLMLIDGFMHFLLYEHYGACMIDWSGVGCMINES